MMRVPDDVIQNGAWCSTWG